MVYNHLQMSHLSSVPQQLPSSYCSNLVSILVCAAVDARSTGAHGAVNNRAFGDVCVTDHIV